MKVKVSKKDLLRVITEADQTVRWGSAAWKARKRLLDAVSEGSEDFRDLRDYCAIPACGCPGDYSHRRTMDVERYEKALLRAVRALEDLVNQPHDLYRRPDEDRLRGKIEGVKLAISYLRDELKQDTLLLWCPQL